MWEPGIIAASALLGFDKERKGAAGSHLLADIPLRDLALRHGMIDMVLIFCAEYLFGFWMRRIGICPWDYSGRPTNVNGLIRLDFAPLWFGTGLLFEGITGKFRRRTGAGNQRP